MVLFDASNSMGNRAFGGDGDDSDDDDDDSGAFDDDESGDDDEEEVDDAKMKEFEGLMVALMDDPRVVMLRTMLIRYAPSSCEAKAKKEREYDPFAATYDEDAAVAALVGCVGTSLIRYGHAQGRRRLRDLFAHSRYVMNREQGKGGKRQKYTETDTQRGGGERERQRVYGCTLL